MSTNRRDFIKYMGVATSSLLAASAVPSIAIGNNEPAKKQSPIFDSVNLGPLTLKNRIIKGAMGQYRSDANGSPTPDLMRVYNEWAAGGAALLITGRTNVQKAEDFEGTPSICDDSQIPAYKEYTDGVHKNGSKICIQITAARNLEPAPVTDSNGTVIKKGMTKEEIKDCIDAFAKAAVRAQEAGFDAIEFQSCHHYIISKFFAPYFNTRTDEYGGKEIENRARFGFEIVEAVRKAVGKDFPLIAKIEGNDYLGRGNTQKDIDYIAQGLVDRGINALEISGGSSGDVRYRNIVRDILYKEDQIYFSRNARNLAKSVNVPLILTGGVRDVELMEISLEHNKNLVAFSIARALLAEPDLPLKWQKNPSYTPKCITCNWCIDNTGKQKLQCTFRRDKA